MPMPRGFAGHVPRFFASRAATLARYSGSLSSRFIRSSAVTGFARVIEDLSMRLICPESTAACCGLVKRVPCLTTRLKVRLVSCAKSSKSS